MTTVFVVLNNSFYGSEGSSAHVLRVHKTREGAEAFVAELYTQLQKYKDASASLFQKNFQILNDLRPGSDTYQTVIAEQNDVLESIVPTLDIHFDIDASTHYDIEEVEFVE